MPTLPPKPTEVQPAQAAAKRPAVGRPVAWFMVGTVLLLGGLLSLLGPSTQLGKALAATVTVLVTFGLYRLARRPIGDVWLNARLGRFVSLALLANAGTEYYRSVGPTRLWSLNFLHDPLGQKLAIAVVVQAMLAVALLKAERFRRMGSVVIGVAPIPGMLYALAARQLLLTDPAPHTLSVCAFGLMLALGFRFRAPKPQPVSLSRAVF